MRERLAKRRAARTKQEEMDSQDELERSRHPKTAKEAFEHVKQFVPVSVFTEIWSGSSISDSLVDLL